MNFDIPTKTLNDGLTIPAIGFGTYALNGYEGVNALVSAIHAGYRLIDTAYNYENEGAVGQAVKKAGVPREDLFIVSKLPGRHHAFPKAVKAIQESLLRAHLDYYDSYLIHWPNPQQDRYVEAWQALIEARTWGLVRSIGVCNFLPEHLKRLERETGIVPSLNQIELHPFFSQKDMVDWSDSHGIVTEAWSPLGRKQHDILSNPTLVDIAGRHGKSVAQAVLRWQVQQGIVPIPKSKAWDRQRENLAVFDFTLTDEEMAALSKLNKPDGRIDAQDPATYEEY